MLYKNGILLFIYWESQVLRKYVMPPWLIVIYCMGRTIRVPNFVIPAILGLVFIVTAFSYVEGRLMLAEYRQNIFQEQIKILERSSIANRDRLNRLISSEESARLISGLPLIHPDIRQLGVGGRVNIPLNLDYNINSTDERVSVLYSEMEASRRMSSLSLRSMEDIKKQIEEIDLRWQYIPSVTPVTGIVTSSYGRRSAPFTGLYAMHRGIDIAAASGTPVRAPANGIVVKTGMDTRYGLHIDLDHQNGFKTRYGHLSTVLVKQGMEVVRGDLIGHVGMTGRASGHHLHYEVHKNRRRVDPMKYIRSENGC